MSREPNPRRFAIWAVALVLPLVLAAAALPWLRRSLAPAGSLQAASATARAAEAAAAGRASQADAAAGGATPSPPGGAEPPRPEARPTEGQIEAARRAQEALIEAQRGWGRSETMAPRQPRRDADGALVSPFQGFGLSIESTPPGATVRVAGREVGQTPLVTGVDCRPGQQVEVRIERRGLPPQVRQVRCRQDALVSLEVALAR